MSWRMWDRFAPGLGSKPLHVDSMPFAPLFLWPVFTTAALAWQVKCKRRL